MGNLLGAPVTEKETHRGFTPEGVAWGVSSMQGWRIHMEDAHICQPFLYAEERIEEGASSSGGGGGGGDSDGDMMDEANDDGAGGDGGAKGGANSGGEKYIKIPVPGHSLYAVYDGHGGSFAAEYSGGNFCRVLARQEKFVRYAKLVREENERNKKKEAEAKDKMASSSSSDNPGDDDGEGNGDEGGAGDAKKDDAGEKGEEGGGGEDGDDAAAVARRAAAGADFKKLMDMFGLLEGALRDAFVDLDREILREMRGLPNEDANAPYGEDFDEHHSHGEICKRTVDAAEDDDDAEGAGKKNKPGGGSGASAKGKPNAGNDKPSPSSDDEDSGTTAIVVVLAPRFIMCANAGDSRAVYSTSSGRVVPLSYDHKPDDEEEERRIRDAGGYVSGGRVEGDLAVSRGLGDFRFKDAESVLAGIKIGGEKGGGGCGDNAAKAANSSMSNAGGRNQGRNSGHAMVKPENQMVSPVPDIIIQRRDPAEDEFIVVACDGIWDVQTNLECVRTVSEIFQEGEDDVGLLCEELLDVCLRRGSKDNMTALVVRLEAQASGDGGGVLARREMRDAAAREVEEGRTGGEQGGSGGGSEGGEGEKRKRDDFFSGSQGYS